MLCRRCGMESSTTDVCEWCKQPMLSPGEAAGAQSPESPREQTEPSQQQQPTEGPQEQESKGEEPGDRTTEETPPQASEGAAPEDILQPLEEAERPTERPAEETPAPAAPAAPSHGLSDAATETSVDLSQYLDGEESILRPIGRPTGPAATAPGADPERATAGARATRQREPESSVSDNVRLLRCLIGGIVISMILAIIQFAITKHVPTKLYFIPLGHTSTPTTAVLYGLLTGVLFGGGLGALLVKFKRGSFLGLLMGVAVGAGINVPYSMVAGGLTGLIAGHFASVGRRTRIGA